MSAFETSATVGDHGEIHLAGVPFQPGAEVEVVVSPKKAPKSDLSPALAAADRLGRLFEALDRARNSEPIGSLRREELHDRDHIH